MRAKIIGYIFNTDKVLYLYFDNGMTYEWKKIQ